MNTQTLIEALQALDPTNEIDAAAFLQSCEAYVDKMEAWIAQVSNRYAIDLSFTETNDGRTPLNNTVKINSAIAADLYYQYSFLNRKIDIDKVSSLAAIYPEHSALKMLASSANYYGMSLQSFLHDAEGGIMSINAHTMFAQNRTGSVMGQLINQVIMPGIRQISAEYTGSFTGEEPKQKRGLFFEKAHSGLIKRVEEDMLRIFFMENYQPYMIENPIEDNISNDIYQDKHAAIMKDYDDLLMRQTQKVNEEYNKFAENYKRRTGAKKIDFILQDSAFAKLESEMREQETLQEKELKKAVENLPHSKENKRQSKIVNKRDYSDNTKKCFRDLCSCLSYLEAYLKKEKSAELSSKLKKTILDSLGEHGFAFERKPTLQKS